MEEVDDGEEEDDVDAIAEPFNFIHVGWLQRWLNGQTEREWSDEQAERAVAETRGRGGGGKGAVEGGDKGDAIVVDGEEDSSEKEARESPTPQDGIIVLSDDDDNQRSTSPPPLSFTSASSASLSSPPSRISPPPTSASSTAHFDTDDPLWPGDLFESCARLLCPHNKLDPRLHKLRLTKRISLQAWSHLVKANVPEQLKRAQFLVDAGLKQPGESGLREPVVLDDQSLCVECVVEMRDESSQLSAQRGQYEALAEGMKEFTSMTGRSAMAFKSGAQARSGMLLDRDWYKHFTEQLKKWNTKAYSGVPLPSTNAEDINKGLICSHGSLRTNHEQHAFLISPQLWKCFADLYPNATDLPARTYPCSDCEAADEADLVERELLAKDLTREHDKYKLGPVMHRRHDQYPDAKRPPTATTPDPPYYLLPARWMLNKFVPYHEQSAVDSSKKVTDRPPPAPMRELFCPHGRLRYNPVPKGLGGELDGEEKGEVTYCEAVAWRGLVECGYVEDGGELKATMTVQDVPDDDLSNVGWRSVIVEFDPPPCEECILARQRSDHRRLHEFKGGSLTVKHIPITTPLGSVPSTTSINSAEQSSSSTSATASSSSSSSSSHFTAPTTTSPRSRSRRNRAYRTLEELQVHDVHASDDVATLKMKISQYCTHNPAHMRLFWREREMREGRPLSEYGVTDGGELLMKVDTEGGGEAWSVDYMDYLPMEDTVRGDDVESGFAGTRLGGGGGGEGKKTTAKAANTGSPASTAAVVAEMKEDGFNERSTSSSQPVSNAAAAKEESKEGVRSSTVRRQLSNHNAAAPILPRIADSHADDARSVIAAPAVPAATAAPSQTVAPAPALAPVSTSPAPKSGFLASLLEREEQRKNSPALVEANSSHSHSHNHSQETKEREATAGHAEEDDLTVAKRMQEQYDAELKEQTDRQHATTAADRQRRDRRNGTTP